MLVFSFACLKWDRFAVTHLSINKRPMIKRQREDRTTATTANAVVLLYPVGTLTGSVIN